MTITKHIEVYFKSEDKIEAAHASLKTLKTTSNLYIEEMPEDDGVKMFVPFFPTNIASSSSTTGTLGSYGSFPPFMTQMGSDDDPDRMTHLLRFDVEEEDYNQAIEVLKKNNAFSLKE